MNILMMSNTYTPIVGGLERSIRTFTEEYRRRGHRVVIVAPSFEGMPSHEEGVIRLPALKHVRGTDFSMKLAVPGLMRQALKDFRPELIHAHHPFFIGGTALRAAYHYGIPLVFTHHTLFEQNTHYFTGDSEWFKRFVVFLTTGYANLTDRVLAPSAGVKELLRIRGVRAPIDIVPTGVDPVFFVPQDRARARAALGLSDDAFVIGTAGRLAEEKNLEFLTHSVSKVLERDETAQFLVVGAGAFHGRMRRILHDRRLESRALFTGVMEGKRLASAYAAMDVFAFASKSETQGLAALEAMACGVPVVALDATGLRDIVQDGVNGRLCRTENEADFAKLLTEFRNPEVRARSSQAARRFASGYTSDTCATLALSAYEAAIRQKNSQDKRRPEVANFWRRQWSALAAEFKADWDLASNMTHATKEASEKPKERCADVS